MLEEQRKKKFKLSRSFLVKLNITERWSFKEDNGSVVDRADNIVALVPKRLQVATIGDTWSQQRRIGHVVTHPRLWNRKSGTFPPINCVSTCFRAANEWRVVH